MRFDGRAGTELPTGGDDMRDVNAHAPRSATGRGGAAGAPHDDAPRLSTEACELLNRWIESTTFATRRDDGGAAQSALQAMAAWLCDEARGQDPRRVERLVIALHTSWSQLPAVRASTPIDRRAEQLEQLVAACIAAFYGPRTRRAAGA
jgi:hypothetical protein